MIKMMRNSAQQKGFTLIEMIVVIVITGILGGIVAVFIKVPVQGYMDSARRAEITDIADTSLRRIERDLRTALPNSIRVTGACSGTSTCFIEYLPTTGGGRYRSAQDCSAACTGDVLDFTIADTSFDVLGTMPSMVAGDQIVIYNLGIPGADAYLGDNRTAYSSNTATTITIAPKQFPFDSPGHHFQVVSTPVSYVCTPATGGVGGTLTRWQGYAIQTAQPTSLPAGTSATLATNVSSCSFTYDLTSSVAVRSALVTMNLAITESGESVTLYSTAHVSNAP